MSSSPSKQPADGSPPEGTAPVGDLLVDTALVPDDRVPGRWHGEMSPAWTVFYVFGGVTMAAAMRATELTVDRPDLELLTTTATFCAPVPTGPLTVDVDVLRSSKAAAQATASLRVPDSDDVALHLVSVFGRRHDGAQAPAEFTEVEFPSDVGDPDDYETVGTAPEEPEASGRSPGPFRSVNFHRQLLWRPAIGHSPMDPGWEPGPARYAAWMRFRRDPRDDNGNLIPAALAVPGDSLGPAVWQRLGPVSEERPPFLMLSLEITLHLLQPARSPWVLQNVRCDWAQDGYALGTTELWSGDRSLIAMAVQRARLRPFDTSQL